MPEERPDRERSSKLLYKDERGKCLDFHALRGQFVSNLARAGDPPKVAQQLARHFTIQPTMGSYAQLDTADLAGAFQALPSFDHSPKIGTKNASENTQNWPDNSHENRPENWHHGR